FGVLLLSRGVMVLGRSLAALAVHGRRRAQFGLRAGTVLAVLLTLLSTISLGYCYRWPKQDYAGALSYVSAARDPDDPVVVAGRARVRRPISDPPSRPHSPPARQQRTPTGTGYVLANSRRRRPRAASAVRGGGLARMGRAGGGDPRVQRVRRHRPDDPAGPGGV